MEFDDSVLLIAQGGGVMSPEILTGVYRVFQEQGVLPGKVMASSGGALFSGLYYSGHDSKWFTQLMQTKDLSEWMQLAPLQAVKSLFKIGTHVIDNTGLKNFLYQNMTAKAMDRVKVSVTKLDDYTSHIKPATPGWVLAATSIPFVFKPVKAAGCAWADGGVLNNVPVPKLKQLQKYRRVYIVLTPPMKYQGDMVGLGGLIQLLNGVMQRQVAQLKEAGYFDLQNVYLIQPSDDHGGHLLKWSDQFGMRQQAYQITKKIVEENGI